MEGAGGRSVKASPTADYDLKPVMIFKKLIFMFHGNDMFRDQSRSGPCLTGVKRSAGMVRNSFRSKHLPLRLTNVRAKAHLSRQPILSIKRFSLLGRCRRRYQPDQSRKMPKC